MPELILAAAGLLALAMLGWCTDDDGLPALIRRWRGDTEGDMP